MEIIIYVLSGLQNYFPKRGIFAMLTPPVDMLRGGGMHMHLEGGGPCPPSQKKKKKKKIQNPSKKLFFKG
jgi:hypothetical protein